MPQTAAPAVSGTAAKGFPARILGVIFTPRAAYADVAARPAWLGAVLGVLALGAIFVLPLDYARETMSSPTTLSVFLPFLEENSFLARFLGSIDLIRVWWFVSLSIGLAVLYRKRTGPIAVTMLVVYAVIAL